MKNICIRILPVLSFLLIVAACKKETPAGCINISTNSPVVNQSVTFTDCSNGAISAAWDFGDGTTGNGVATAKTYTAVGTYVVTLISTTTGAQTTTTKKTLVVSSLPNAAFTVTWCGINASQTSPGMFDTVWFTPSAGSTSFLWGFGDGSTSHDSVPFHIFTQAGSYTVKLTAGNTLGSDSSTQTITVVGPYAGYYSATNGASATLASFSGYNTGSTFSLTYQGGGANYMYNFTVNATLTGATTFSVPSQTVPLAGNGSLTGTVHGHGSIYNAGSCSAKLLLNDTAVGNSGTQVLIDTL